MATDTTHLPQGELNADVSAEASGNELDFGAVQTAAATDAAGKSSLSGLPPGSYTLRAQLDEKTHCSMPVTITAGKTATVDFSKPSAAP